LGEQFRLRKMLLPDPSRKIQLIKLQLERPNWKQREIARDT